MHEHIYREYDIRGNVDRELTGAVVQRLGQAIGTYYRRHGVSEMTLGRDCRLSSEKLRDALVAGLLATGMSITDIGVCHTPLLYFSLFHLDKDAGVMITGSHNPPEFNGFKVCLGKTTIYGAEIQELKRIAQNGEFAEGAGRISAADIMPAYLERIASEFGVLKGKKIVVDAGNGTGGQAAVPLLKKIGCTVVPLFCEMDGRFPNHHPDPTVPAYLQDLIAAVRSEKADAGIAYDGDGDRIGVVDETGNIIWGDQLLIVFSRDILTRHPGATFISEVKGSQNFYDDVAKHGGRAIMWKTGHSLIKAKMKEEKALLAGEMSGHMFFADRYYGFDDAIYASCRLVEILAARSTPLSALLQDLPVTFTTPEIRIDCPDDRKFHIIEKVKKSFTGHYAVIDIDGARITMPGGWGLVRASNTQPVLVLRFEAATRQRLEEIQTMVETIVQQQLRSC
jgi:phosphomannomutase/phosphoglucomutase